MKSIKCCVIYHSFSSFLRHRICETFWFVFELITQKRRIWNDDMYKSKFHLLNKINICFKNISFTHQIIENFDRYTTFKIQTENWRLCFELPVCILLVRFQKFPVGGSIIKALFWIPTYFRNFTTYTYFFLNLSIYIL